MFQNYYLEDISIKRVGNYLYEFFNDANAPINLVSAWNYFTTIRMIGFLNYLKIVFKGFSN